MLESFRGLAPLFWLRLKTGRGLFGVGRFGPETFRSDYEILLHVHFLLQTSPNQRKVLF